MKYRIAVLVAATASLGWLSQLAQAQVAQESGYALDYQLSIPVSANFNSNTIPYTVNNSALYANGSFARVAYELTLSGSTNSNSPNGNIWVSFNTPSNNASLLGVPSVGPSGSGQVFGGAGVVQFVNNMTVIASGSPALAALSGTGITDGNIQFWPTDYSGDPANNNQFDWANTNGGTQGGNYAAMDISEVNPADHTKGQMLISYNDWGGDGGNSGLGLGDNPSGNPDYTFRNNAGDYKSAILTVWVSVPEPSSIVAIVGLGAMGLIGFARRRRKAA